MPNFKCSEKIEEEVTKYCQFKGFGHIITLVLSQNSVKGLRVAKAVKEIKFEGVWNELELKTSFERK